MVRLLNHVSGHTELCGPARSLRQAQDERANRPDRHSCGGRNPGGGDSRPRIDYRFRGNDGFEWSSLHAHVNCGRSTHLNVDRGRVFAKIFHERNAPIDIDLCSAVRVQE